MQRGCRCSRGVWGGRVRTARRSPGCRSAHASESQLKSTQVYTPPVKVNRKSTQSETVSIVRESQHSQRKSTQSAKGNTARLCSCSGA
eukprot:453430-Rhodomonas_salina.1